MAENVSIVIRAFDKTKKGFGSATKGIASIAKSVVSLRSALILVGGAAGFGYMVKSSLNATDALKKTADKIGTTTEALGGLRYAAQITGVATNTMDMALQRFTRRTAEAAKGTGEAKGAIKELGINAKELNRMPLDERMLVLADAFGGVSNESDKLRLAFKLFDSEGAALVNTLSLGRDGLRELLGEAKLLGLTMSTNAAVGVEKANDEITKLLSLGKGLKDQFSAALAPAITEVTKRITAFFLAISKDEGGIEKWARGMAKSFIEATIVVVKSLDTILTNVGKAFQFFKDQITSFKKWQKSTDLKGFAKEADIASAAYTKLMSGGDLTSSDIKGLGGLADGVKSSVEDVAARYYELQGLIEEIEADISGGSPIDFSNIIDVKSFEKITLQLVDGIDKGFEAVKKGAGDGVKELSNIQQAYIDWQKTIMDTDDIVKSFTTQALDGMTNALTAGITGAANFADAMREMAKSVIDSLIKMLIQKYIVDQAFGAITTYFSQGVSSSTNFGPSDLSAPNAGPQPSGRAIGGSVQAGQSYMVGERGSEMFVPNQSGSIVPNNKMGSGSGITINQTINVTTGIQSTVRAEIVGLMPQIAQAAKGAVADARVRGGNFSKAMVGA
jgi:hypothetical protein